MHMIVFFMTFVRQAVAASGEVSKLRQTISKKFGSIGITRFRIKKYEYLFRDFFG